MLTNRKKNFSQQAISQSRVSASFQIYPGKGVLSTNSQYGKLKKLSDQNDIDTFLNLYFWLTV